ncbi:transcriptional regulator, AraC family [Burkholderia sp. OK233]|nr:transcriptional regulator, AraC family [Burkholderia sp. OK233]
MTPAILTSCTTSAIPVLTLSELRIMLDLFSSRGLSSVDVLRHIDVVPDAISDPRTLISIRQQLRALDFAMRALGDRMLPLEVAKGIHLTSYGIVGFALLSSPTLADAIHLAFRYHLLLNGKWTNTLVIDGDRCSIHFAEKRFDENFLAFECLIMEVGKVLSLMKDLLGPTFTPCLVRIPKAPASSIAEYSRLLGCKIELCTSRPEIRFDSAWLAQPLQQANAVTHESCTRTCDFLINEFFHRKSLLDEVKDVLLRSNKCIPSLSEVANLLFLSPRTLRRRLRDQGTSYNQLLNDVRSTLATQYLTTTRKTTEEIAEVLGYSDAANFRHAFKRWTGESPRQFRIKFASTEVSVISPRQRAQQIVCPLMDAGTDFSLASFWTKLPIKQAIA